MTTVVITLWLLGSVFGVLAYAYWQRQRALATPLLMASNIIQQMSEALVVLDTQARIAAVNPATTALLGYTDEELLGRPFHQFLRRHPGLFHPQTLRQLNNGHKLHTYEIGFVSKSGEEIPVSFSIAPMRHRNHKLAGAVGVGRDLREINQLRDRLIQSEKLASIGQLAAGVAHEIDNPLNVIAGRASVLALQAPDNPSAQEAAAIIKEQVRRAAAITSRLCHFAKEAPMSMEQLSLNHVMDEAVALVAYQIGGLSHSVTIEKSYAQTLPPVLGDKIQLQEVFVNLLLNGAQAMPKGGTLTVRTYSTVASRYGEGAGRRKSDAFRLGEEIVVVEVQDMGVGIPPEHLQRVFDPFFSTKDMGTGLGLAVSFSIIERHRGVMTVDSPPEGGTTFYVYLPVAPATAEITGSGVGRRGGRSHGQADDRGR